MSINKETQKEYLKSRVRYNEKEIERLNEEIHALTHENEIFKAIIAEADKESYDPWPP